MNENTATIKQFVAKISDKNYSEANQALNKIIENKLKERIKTSLQVKK